jgi:hypothetical protein
MEKFEADTDLFNVSEVNSKYDFKVYGRRIQTFDAYLNLRMKLLRHPAASSIWAMQPLQWPMTKPRKFVHIRADMFDPESFRTAFRAAAQSRRRPGSTSRPKCRR